MEDRPQNSRHWERTGEMLTNCGDVTHDKDYGDEEENFIQNYEFSNDISECYAICSTLRFQTIHKNNALQKLISEHGVHIAINVVFINLPSLQ